MGDRTTEILPANVLAELQKMVTVTLLCKLVQRAAESIAFNDRLYRYVSK